MWRNRHSWRTVGEQQPPAGPAQFVGNCEDPALDRPPVICDDAGMSTYDHADLARLPTALPFRAVLRPYRSLSSRGFALLMTALAVPSLVVGIVFTLLGAWPIFGFFGLDVLLVYALFKRNYRMAKSAETIEVDRRNVTVTRFSPEGRRISAARLDAYWARLEITETDDGECDLALALRQRRLPVARDLGPMQRRAFAPALAEALRLVRRADGL